MGDIVLVRVTIEKWLAATGADGPALHTRIHHNQPTPLNLRISQPVPDPDGPDDTATIRLRPAERADYWERSDSALVFEGEIAPEEQLATRIEFHGLDPGRTDGLLRQPVVERARCQEEADSRWTPITPDFVTQRLCQEIPGDSGDRAVVADGGPTPGGNSPADGPTAEPGVIEGLEESVAELEAKMDALEDRLDGSLLD